MDGMGVDNLEASRTGIDAPAPTPLRFIDLFAGLGGFHQALTALGCECVFAAELDPGLRDLYERNFGVRPAGDIRTALALVPQHDILCAGFPCQPFSKAGDQRGFDCPQWGDLFDYVVDILEAHQPKFLLIENVPNIIRHNNGQTWLRIQSRLRLAGYDVASALMSPHMFGVPQVRQRAIIVGRLKSLGEFEWPAATHRKSELNLASILESNPIGARPLSDQYKKYLEAWQELLSSVPSSANITAFPIWAMEFGATYPYDNTIPAKLKATDLGRYSGSFGRALQGKKADMVAGLPPYARSATEKFPSWKVEFIRANRDFYDAYRSQLDPHLKKIAAFPPSFQKLEWNWKDGPRDISSALVQFRASGIRVRSPSTSPSLVALTASQVPVVAKELRYLTVRECAKLQSMNDLKFLPGAETSAFRALGNAVNVKLMKEVAGALLGNY